MADKISVSNKGFEKLAEEFKNQPKRLEKATRLAANKAMRGANTLVKRGLQSETGTRSQKAFTERRRLFYETAKQVATIASSGVASKTPRDAFARLWIGLNAVPARERYWGAARQEESGASLGKYFFAKAWVGYRGSKLGAGIYQRIGRDRFPIKLQGIEIDRPGVRAMIDRVVDVTEARFSEEVIRILNIDWDKVSSKVSA